MNNKLKIVVLTAALGLHFGELSAQGFGGIVPSPEPIPGILLDAMWDDPQGPFIPNAAVDIGGGDYIWLFRAISLGKYNLPSKKNIIGWPLNHWPHQTIAPEQKKAHDDFHMDFPSTSYQLGMEGNRIGCYADTPLRYGDIEGDGKNEIVLFLGNDVVIFSPDNQRIVFAQSLDAGDWVDAEDTVDAYLERNLGTTSPRVVQYLSGLAYSNDGLYTPGTRVYSKLYFGDFDKDNNPDIVVWTKAYRSKLKSDPLPGFDAIRQNWYHFERDLTAQADSPAGVTGEYLPQTTDAPTIQTWLTDNALTWKKGYPDVSECAADNGGPIPEMSDSLLNDPEVLQ